MAPTLAVDITTQLLGDLRERTQVVDKSDLPDSGLELLKDMKDRLALEGDELQRMEDEGGLPQKPAQQLRANECLKASQNIETLLSVSHTASNDSPVTKETTMADSKINGATRDMPKPDAESPPMDGSISATASIATVGVAVGAALGVAGGPAGIIAGAAIGGSIGALAGAKSAESANHAEEVANEENEENHHPVKPAL